MLDELRQHFRPEFLNRVDEIIVFHSLAEEHLKQIVEIQLGGSGSASRIARSRSNLPMPRELTSCRRLRPELRSTSAQARRPEGDRNASGTADVEGEIRDGQTVVVDYDSKGAKLTFTPKLVEEPVLKAS